MNEPTSAKTCFVLAPFGDESSDTRRRSDQVLRHIIRPALEPLGFVVSRADEISSPGSITSQIIARLMDADLVVADLTGHNPNVMYELGLRHAFGKPALHLAATAERLPFDITNFRTILFDYRDLDSVARARDAIRAAAVTASDTPTVHSPVEAIQRLRSHPTIQRLPVRAYLRESDPAHEKRLAEAIGLLTKALNLIVTDDPPPQKGSWFKHWFAATAEVASQPEVAERLRKVERAVELRALHQQQAEVDKTQAEAVNALITALEHVENAAVQIGSLLVVKVTQGNHPSVLVRSLSLRELDALERDPSLLKAPELVLDVLAGSLRADTQEITPPKLTDG